MVGCDGIICLIGAMVRCGGNICLLVVCVIFFVLCFGVWHELITSLGVCGLVIMFGRLLGVCGLVMLLV